MSLRLMTYNILDGGHGREPLIHQRLQARLVPDQPEFEEFARPRANEQHEGVLLSSPHKFSLLRY